MADEQVKRVHPREKVRGNLDSYIDRLHHIFMSDDGIAGMKAGEMLFKIADVSSIEVPPAECIAVVTADPSKRKASENVTPIREAV